MELEPFTRINPCGYQGLEVTQLLDFGVSDGVEAVGHKLANILIGHLSEKKSGSAGG
jgi:lipoyl(octanoyl) transferase